jgi:hypothetical protein
MKLSPLLLPLLTYTTTTSATLTFTLAKSNTPTPDESDAYTRIESAIRLAIARHTRLTTLSKALRVSYAPGVPTAEANYNGDVRFGSNRAYMNERTALHEISHTLGVGQTAAFNTKCAAGDWATALPLLRSWDGPDAVINCGGSHFWPYGLNYDSEMSETNADRHVELVEAMVADGM